MKGKKVAWIVSFIIAFSIIFSMTVLAGNDASSSKGLQIDENLYKAMKWRCIGPFRGGRVTAVAGVSSQPHTYFFGATGGGVWKTEDGGLHWKPVSDGFFKTGSVGAIAVSGTYTVRLTAGDRSWSQNFEWLKDPRIPTTQDEFQAQFDLLIKIRDKLTEVNTSIVRLRDVKDQIRSLIKKVESQEKGKEIAEAGKRIMEKLEAVENVLIQSRSKSSQDPLNYPILLDNKIAALASVAASADARPTDQCCALFEELSAKADAQLGKLREILEAEIPALNKMVQEGGIPAILVK